MKGLNNNLLIKILLSVLLGVQVIAVNANDIYAEISKAYRQELVREIRNNVESLDLDKQRLDVQIKQKIQDSEKKSVSYLPILGLIITDAVGNTESELQVNANKEAGKIR